LVPRNKKSVFIYTALFYVVFLSSCSVRSVKNVDKINCSWVEAGMNIEIEPDSAMAEFNRMMIEEDFVKAKELLVSMIEGCDSRAVTVYSNVFALKSTENTQFILPFLDQIIEVGDKSQVADALYQRHKIKNAIGLDGGEEELLRSAFLGNDFAIIRVYANFEKKKQDAQVYFLAKYLERSVASGSIYGEKIRSYLRTMDGEMLEINAFYEEHKNVTLQNVDEVISFFYSLADIIDGSRLE